MVSRNGSEVSSDLSAKVPVKEKVLLLQIPPIALVLGELGFRGAAGFFQQQHFEVLEAEPGGIGEVVIVETLKFWEHITQGLLQFLLGIGAHGEGFVDGLTESLDGIGGAGAEDFRVRFESQELRKRKIPLLKTEPADRLPQVAVLDLVFCMSR